MKARQGTWGELAIGSYLRDQTGVVWRVTRERDFHFLVENRAGEKKHLKPRPGSTPVTIMDATEAEAMTALEQILGAKAVARREAGETGWLVPAFPTPGALGALQEARTHMKLMHGMWCDDVKTMAGLIEAHLHGHQNPERGYQDHTHPGGNPS